MSRAGGDEPSEGLFRWAGRASAALLALITLTTAAVGLIFTFVPGLKPEPDPPERSATITQITVEPAATLGSYFRQIHQLDFTKQRFLRGTKLAHVDPKEQRLARSMALADYKAFLRIRCISVYAQVRITGFEDVQKRLTMNLYDANSGLPVPGFSYYSPTQPEDRAGFEQFRAAQGLDFRSRSDSDQYVGRTCLLNEEKGTPAPRGRYFVRVELEDDSKRLLTFSDSAPFRFDPA